MYKVVRRYMKIEAVEARNKMKGKAIVIRGNLTHENAKLLENTSARDKVKLAWLDEGKMVALLKHNRQLLMIVEQTTVLFL